MAIYDFIASHQSKIVDLWRTNAAGRLALELDRSELINDLPRFVADLIDALQSRTSDCGEMTGARNHGRHRMRIGMDVGGLTEEMTLVGETILELASEEGVIFPSEEVRRLFHCIGRGAAASVRAYASLRDVELATQAADNYSFIAHEIRTPLHSACLAAEMLGTAPKEDQPRHRERLTRALAHVSELVDDSISHARLQGRPRISPTRLTVRELAQHARDDVSELALARGISIELEVADDIELFADQKLLRSALVNLLRNAVKFSRPNSRVEVRATTNSGRALIEVEDSCGGIPEEALPKLFQPFAQRHDDKSGFGLGLLIVKAAVEAHHGAVRVANRPGQGCTFVAELPLNYEED